MSDGRSEASNVRRITNRVVDALQAGEVAYDDTLKGFGVRRRTSSASYFVKKRIKGRQVLVTIGQHGTPWTADTARKEASRIMSSIGEGKDIARERSEARAKPTVKDAFERYYNEHINVHRKESTAEGYAGQRDKYILPAIGKFRVDAVTTNDIKAMHTKAGDQPYAANRVLALCSAFFGWCEQKDIGLRLPMTNPAKGIKKYKEARRETFLSSVQVAALGDALAKHEANGESPYVIALLRLLVLTGARLREIMQLRWEHVDMERRILFLPDSKTGAKPIILNAPAVEVLASLPRIEGNPHVIVGEREGACLVNIYKPWSRISKDAGLEGVRIHDLRHTTASIAAASGSSLVIIGKMLGHRQSQTTMRYAHLNDDPVREASDAVGNKIGTAIMPKSKPVATSPSEPEIVNVVPLRKVPA
jgi:integrase